MFPLHSEDDVVRLRRAVRSMAIGIGFGLVDQTKVVTAASELARNALVHGGGGEARLEILQGARTGLQITVEDTGPGIPNLELALLDGYSTANGLGLGLGGTRRLMHEFQVSTEPGVYTRVVAVRWK
ncbi:anti-sigma regulatory factor [Deinococcus sp. KSM4-11]|uniref:anti-sigma regulatory factor n=1 Tax=Deinococcus sp. KSM4-11 TaxID=2568654 RepID=UPI002107CE5B|nr:anti-sigma regulatory factor [Deinococcus sp. KSM4-11]